MNARVIEAMRRAEIFNDLDDEQLLRISEVCQAVRVAVGTMIFKEGDYGDELYVIYEGKLRVAINTLAPDGTSTLTTINVLYPGQCFGELVLLNTGQRSASVIALEPSTLIMLRELDFRTLCNAMPHIGYRVIYNLAQDLAIKLRNATMLLRGNIHIETGAAGGG